MRNKSNPVRGFLAAILLMVGVLLAPVTLVANWLQHSVVDQDNFVSLYSPVAGKADFQVSVANQIAETAAEAVDTSSVLNSLQSMSRSATSSIDKLLDNFGIDGDLKNRTGDWGSQLVDSVHQTVLQHALPAVQSPQFSVAWTESLRTAQAQIISGLETGMPTTVTLPAAPYVDLLKDSLINQGYDVAQLIPATAPDVTIPLVEVQFNDQWVTAFSYLVTYGAFLPWVNAAILLLGVLVANWRMRALARAALGVAMLSGLLWWSVPHVGSQVVTDVAAGPSQSAAQILWQVGTAPLEATSALVGIISLGVAALAAAFHWATRKRRQY